MRHRCLITAGLDGRIIGLWSQGLALALPIAIYLVLAFMLASSPE